MRNTARHWTLILCSLLVVVLIAGFAAFQFGVRALKGQIEKALGPQGEVKEICIGLTGVEITGVRIRAQKGTDKQPLWPAEDELRAERILIIPDLLDLITAKVSLQSIRVEGAYISMLRARNGQMKVLPSLLEKPVSAGSTPGNPNAKESAIGVPINIGRIELSSGTIEFFDATLRPAPVKLRLEQINAHLDKLQLPELKGQSPIMLDGILKGVRQDGKIAISGSIELATKESGLSTRLHGVDLVVLQPYLIKAIETGVKKGTLDFELNSSVKKGTLHAPGSITLSDLELTSTSGTIMGLPRNAAVAMMKNRKGKISVNFVLDGNINDPYFSLNENLTTRIAASLGNSLGISVEGLAKGVGSVGSSAAKGIGDSIGKVLKK